MENRMRSKILFLVAAVTIGCAPSNRPAPENGSAPNSIAEQESPAVGEAWARLRPVYWTAQDGSRFSAQWSWWANPNSSWLPDHARMVYGPLRDVSVGVPLSWRPFYDSRLASLCWFYATADGETRCLPGWAQMDADDERDGYYSEPTCSVLSQWLAVLPASGMAQRFLVLVRPVPGSMPDVYAARPFDGRVWRRRPSLAGPRECVEVGSDQQLRFFQKGDQQPLSGFVPLGATDSGPG